MQLLLLSDNHSLARRDDISSFRSGLGVLLFNIGIEDLMLLGLGEEVVIGSWKGGVTSNFNITG